MTRRTLLLLILIGLLVLAGMAALPPDFGPWLLAQPYRP
jgi:hypothetical protein